MTHPDGFADTSTEEFLNGQQEGEGEEGGEISTAFNPLSGFTIDPALMRQNTEAPANEGSGDGKEGGEASGGQTSAEGGSGGDDGGATDYKASYVDWAKTKGLEVDASKLPETFGEAEMQKEVALYYTSQVVKDPLVLELAKTGLTLQQYNDRVAPLKQVESLPSKEFFAHMEANKAVQDQIGLGQLKADDQAAKKAYYDKAKAESLEKVKNLDDAAVENVVAAQRQAVRDNINELPNRIAAAQEQAQKQQFEKLRKEYEEEHKTMMEGVRSRVVSGNENYGIPFGGQAERTEFLDYFERMTKFGDVKVKDESGKETVVQDFPFLKMLEDEAVQAKVLRVLFAMEKGTFTDLKNNIRQAAKKDLGLEPNLTPSRTANPNGGNSKWADTSTATFLRGGQ